MKKLLQIDVCLNWGSTGRIAENIAKTAMKKGWECYMIHGSRYCNPPSVMNAFRPGSVLDEYWHYFEHKAFDNDGLSSDRATKRAVQFIKLIQPDLIQIHTIHDHWLNYKILFEYLVTLDIPVVWTQHDCWSFTGGCGYYTYIGCSQWMTKCGKCPAKGHKLLPLVERTDAHFRRKKELMLNVKNLTLVPVSKWLEGEIRQSFLKGTNIVQIYNGVDVGTFHPVDGTAVRERLRVGDRRMLIGVATTWSERKGLTDYHRLARLLPSDMVLVLIGLTRRQQVGLPSNIIGLPRTQDVNELVQLYSAADIVMNLSYEETFGLTTVEGFACGTPSIVYNCTASPELVTSETGVVVNPGDIEGVMAAVEEILRKGKGSYSDACRRRAVDVFNMEDRFADYITLYEELLGRTL